MKYEQKYKIEISLSVPLLEKIILIEPLHVGINLSFEDPKVEHWRYKLKVGDWDSDLTDKLNFRLPFEPTFECITLYIHDSDSNSVIGEVLYE